MIGAVLHDALGHHARASEPGLEPAPIRAAGGEGEHDAFIDVLWPSHACVALRRDQHQLLGERVLHLQVLRRKRLGDERRLDLAAQHPVDQRAARAGDELEPHRRVAAVIAREHRRQARRRGALEGTEPEEAVRPVALERRLRLRGEPQQPVGVGEQHLALGGQHELAPLAVEELGAQALLELLHARRDVGLHAVQRGGGLGDAALLGDGLEDLQLDQIHWFSERERSVLNYSFFRISPSIYSGAWIASAWRSPVSPPWSWPWVSAASPSRPSCR